MDVILQAFALVATGNVIVTIIAASMFGLFVGAVPGLTATMATALLVPLTFFMEPVAAVGAIVACSAMAIFAGDIPGALLRIPGTPASAAYVEDTYKLTQKGQAELGLGACVLFSALGGLFGTIVLIFAAPSLAEFAVKFSSPEYFWIALLGLTCAVFMGASSPAKGLLSLFIGLTIASVGLNNPAGVPRLTFGSTEMMAGIDFIPVMIGIFAISEVLRTVLSGGEGWQQAPEAVGNIFRDWGGMLRTYWKQLLRGNITGTAVGILPGAGSDVAAYVSYAISRRFSKTPEKYGTGHVEGVVEAGAANNASLSSAWVPALVFGIPGDTMTAIVIGVLYVKGMNPGPTLFIFNPQTIYAVFLIFILANLIMIPLGWALIKFSKNILRVSKAVLMPLILIFCIVGAFASNNAVYGVTIMLIFGVVGYLMEENDFPIAPCVLGIVIGPILEKNLITTLIKSQGNLLDFINRPIAFAIFAIFCLLWLSIIVSWIRAPRRTDEMLRAEPD
ncbi:tripartite tricarboxylate transporter permease [Rhizobium sp. LC145]|uniref:tripartite tricarboxylate transporter permease n=1 Tax=Rhizobium sp. LC145 TaxID=1120688 RepID=UPI00062A3A1D|nr:tripartite tricarboxylate transporter permease [Rhizobium sp. LC145]KKX26275.1 C4-dicarboxylate ABC transporter permease [Rhizobium sp. LC145]TKT67218.1 C4-dicarboxylate ABC transporter permease [Rhizobiaceae bacterium LC148]